MKTRGFPTKLTTFTPTFIFESQSIQYTMRILIIPDKFKGSMTSAEAIEVMTQACLEQQPQSVCEGISIADGGEGSLASLREVLQCEEISCTTQDALGRLIKASYLRSGKQAYIETSRSCGLMLLDHKERNPLQTNTFGVGMMVRHAILQGCKDIHLFLGGSGTHDAGTGMAAALGFTFSDVSGRQFAPSGGTLTRIQNIHQTSDTKLLEGITFKVWTDVMALLTGQNGAIMFAPQKGATTLALQVLAQGTEHISSLFSEHFPGYYYPNLPGGGAAGGLAAGAAAFLGASIGSGWEFFLEIHRLEQKIALADLVITGEGKLDGQTLKGKCVGGIAALCRKHKKPCFIFCGSSELSSGEKEVLGNPHIFTLQQAGETIEQSIKSSSQRLRHIVCKAYGVFLRAIDEDSSK